jgi:hypothetical protein
MRKLIIGLLLLLSVGASAQWQQTGSKVRYVNGIGIPTKDTAAGVSADSSQILIRPADSSLYVKYKRTWMRVGGGGGSIAGSGTTNYIPKFTSSSAIGNSQIFDNGTAVGIGTISPIGKLEVASAASNSSVGFNVGTSVSPERGNLFYHTDGTGWKFNIGKYQSSTFTPQMTFQDNGNVGIGTTSPAYKLVISNAGANGLELDPTGGVGGGVLIQSYNRSTASYISQSNYALSNTFFVGASNTRALDITSSANVGIGYTSPAAKLAVNGRTLINTNTDNGVDALQVSGSALITAGLQAATTSGNVSLRTTANTYPFNISLGANAGIGMYQDGTTATLIGTNQNISATAPLQILGTTLTLNASGNNNAQIFTNSNERLRVTGAGNVIIDPTQLGAKLLVNTTTDAGTDVVQIAGSISAEGIKQRYLARTTTYTATTSDYFIDCTSGTFTVNLFTAVGNTGRILIIKNSGTGTITVDPNGTQTIDGATTQSLATQWSRVHIISDGANWKIISN